MVLRNFLKLTNLPPKTVAIGWPIPVQTAIKIPTKTNNLSFLLPKRNSSTKETGGDLKINNAYSQSTKHQLKSLIRQVSTTQQNIDPFFKPRLNKKITALIQKQLPICIVVDVQNDRPDCQRPIVFCRSFVWPLIMKTGSNAEGTLIFITEWFLLFKNFGA